MTWTFILRLLLAGVFGLVIGLDREYRVKEAGFRTHFLVSMGSALLMIVSQYGFSAVLEQPGLRLDPSRIAAQVVSGIGFIGAGTIIFHRQIVRGLTTAAGIWMTATIGMAVGVGMYWCSILATGLILVTLVLLEAWEHRRNIGHENRVLKLQVEGIVQDIEAYREVFNRHKVHLSTYFIEYDYERDSTQLNFVVLAPSHRNYLPMFQDLRVLGRTKSLTLTSQA